MGIFSDAYLPNDGNKIWQLVFLVVIVDFRILLAVVFNYLKI